jgi:hypothetical protein
MIKKCVTFSDKLIFIEEPTEYQKELRESRRSTFFQNQLDKLRYEKLLTPILCKFHREKIIIRNNICKLY